MSSSNAPPNKSPGKGGKSLEMMQKRLKQQSSDQMQPGGPSDDTNNSTSTAPVSTSPNMVSGGGVVGPPSQPTGAATNATGAAGSVTSYGSSMPPPVRAKGKDFASMSARARVESTGTTQSMAGTSSTNIYPVPMSDTNVADTSSSVPENNTSPSGNSTSGSRMHLQPSGGVPLIQQQAQMSGGSVSGGRPKGKDFSRMASHMNQVQPAPPQQNQPEATPTQQQMAPNMPLTYDQRQQQSRPSSASSQQYQQQGKGKMNLNSDPSSVSHQMMQQSQQTPPTQQTHPSMQNQIQQPQPRSVNVGVQQHSSSRQTYQPQQQNPTLSYQPQQQQQPSSAVPTYLNQSARAAQLQAEARAAAGFEPNSATKPNPSRAGSRATSTSSQQRPNSQQLYNPMSGATNTTTNPVMNINDRMNVTGMPSHVPNLPNQQQTSMQPPQNQQRRPNPVNTSIIDQAKPGINSLGHPAGQSSHLQHQQIPSPLGNIAGGMQPSPQHQQQPPIPAPGAIPAQQPKIQSSSRGTGATVLPTGYPPSPNKTSSNRSSHQPALKTTPKPSSVEGSLVALSKATSVGGTPTEKPLLGERVQDLLRTIDPAYVIDSKAEEQVLELADDFLEKICRQSIRVAMHRGSKTVDVQDVQLMLHTQWGITIPSLGPPPSKRNLKVSMSRAAMSLSIPPHTDNYVNVTAPNSGLTSALLGSTVPTKDIGNVNNDGHGNNNSSRIGSNHLQQTSIMQSYLSSGQVKRNSISSNASGGGAASNKKAKYEKS